MLRRFLSVLFLAWAIGFLAFVVALPRPLATAQKTDAVIVLTGAAGRIAHGLGVLEQGAARRLLVSGVDPEVRPGEFAAEFKVAPALMACCVTLGYGAVDTRSNAAETARWVAANKVRSLRLVTTDWHMRRAALELERALPKDVKILRDAVPSQPDFGTLLLEYHKFLASRAAGLVAL